MYNNPFMYGAMSNVARPAVSRGLLGGLKGLNWSGFLSNAQKTLGIINQTIPIVYQIKPIVNNAKTMFKIANTLKEDTPSNNVTNSDNSSNNKKEEVKNDTNKSLDGIDTNKPIFFI